jgi:hypothetical protein
MAYKAQAHQIWHYNQNPVRKKRPTVQTVTAKYNEVTHVGHLE